MNDAILLSREILNAHPTGVRSLFLRYGIGAEPSPRTIILAATAFGDAFVNDLYLLARSSNNFTGTFGVESFTYDPGLINYDSPIFGSGYKPAQYDLSGNVVSAGAPASSSGKSGFEKFQDIFSSVAGMIGTGVNVLNAVKTGQTPQTSEVAQQQAQVQAQMYALQQQDAAAAAASKTKQALIVGAVLLVLVIGAFMLFKKKAKV